MRFFPKTLSLIALLQVPLWSSVESWTTTNCPRRLLPSFRRLLATVVPTDETFNTPPTFDDENTKQILQRMSALHKESDEYAEMFGLGKPGATFHALFGALAQQGHLGLKGTPVVLRRSQVTEAFGGQDAEWKDYFTMRDLEKAVTDDFLDAARGSTDNRKGWKVRGSFFVQK